MSLTFTRESDLFISAKQQDGMTVSVLFCSDKKHKWRVYSISSSFAEPDHLRQIAYKLDELNHEKGLTK